MLADSSVWIDLLRGRATAQVAALRDGLETASIAMGDLIAMEILRGLRQDTGSRIRSRLLLLEMHEMGGLSVCLGAAEFYRLLRGRGITVRSTIDCLIATYCIQGGHTLLHSDRDFDPFEQHLGLQVLHL
ncbi:MAG: type II toxin-antitoxin system VapC family toxin [Tepidiformaceae bacterium]